ncbi:Rieske (2Fe-2S) protein [Planctomyces sp. SH-PL62]|uniref:Rieske (2Fe-2S) protein n=1 Tax=Planctomyces sp. SH-PL62 TaxID=1636152 RepID=UPI00078D59ED|nr:Rieske (2Fe-2S) protein [Planctomyces sp. SH-PL62]AMV37794.1 Cytochrome b6-f complex iron-sulfur subunit [Planctomyces sp. SH-PL62]
MIGDQPEPGTRFPDSRPESEQPPWRLDFPIDVPQDNYIARRDSVKFLVLTSFAFVVGQIWIAAKSLVRGRGAPPSQRIATVDEIPLGGAIGFNYPGPTDPCLLLRTADGTLLAYGQKCTHLSCAVVPELEHDRLHCPCHVGSFDVATGRPLAGPPDAPCPW